MNSWRTLTTYLLLAGLLLSNLAGWVHVGCCVPAEQVSSAKTEPKTRLCACEHHCKPSTAADQESTPGESKPGVPETDDEHDSDRCSVCQNFFASRQATLLLTNVHVWAPLLAERLSAERDDESIEPIFLSGLAVRGPPNA